MTLRGLGTALWDEGRFAEGKELLERALGIFRELDDGAGAAGVLSTLAASYRGDLEQVRRWSDEALAIYRKLGDRHGEATCLAQLAGLVIEMGRPEEGEALVLASQEILRDVGDHSMIAFGYEIQAFLARQASTLDRSLSYLEKALGIHQFTGDRRMEGRLRGLVGFVRWDRGDRRGGSESFDQGLAMLREARELSVQADFLRIRSSYERLLTGDLPSAERGVARAEEIMREIGDLVGLALCRCERASIALASGDVAACREHLDGARAASADAALGTAGTLRTRIVEVEQALGAIERGDGSLLFRGDLKSRVPPALLDA
ncbi:MAG: tetratricopeptide repeat protein [Acidobacteriota bacterium]